MKPIIITFAMTFGGSLVSLFRPYIGFLVYVAFAIISPNALWWWALPQFNYSRIIAIALLLGWILRGCGNWEAKRAFPIVVGAIGYWLVLFAGALFAPDQNVAWHSVEPMAKVFVPWLIGLSLIDSRAKIKQLAWVIVLSEGYLAYEFNLLYYTTMFIPWEWTHSGLDNNGIAITMVTSIGIAFFLGLHAERWWQKAIAFGSTGLMAHVVLFSNSRGGMLALIITGLFCFLLVPKKPKHYLYFALAVALVFRLAGEQVQKRFLTTFQSKEEGSDGGARRRDHWAACIESMVTRPLGVGPHHWPLTCSQYGLPHGVEAHSTWLQTGAELGFPGLLCLGLIYGTCWLRLWPMTRARRPADDPWDRYFARMVIASLIGFIVSAQFVTVGGMELPYYVSLIGAAVLKLSSPAAQRAQQLQRASTVPFRFAPAGLPR